MSDHPYAGLKFEELTSFSNERLEDVLRRGTTPVRDELVGREFNGFNTPTFARVLGFQKFIKGFFEDGDGKIVGYNLFVEKPRAGIGAPWIPKGGGGPDERHGFYDVVAVTPGRYGDYPNAVLLDYGSGRNHRLNPEARIRDFLVQVDPDDPRLLLGKAYVDLGATRVFSNYFVLSRREG
jgi:hypothetical protein